MPHWIVLDQARLQRYQPGLLAVYWLVIVMASGWFGPSMLAGEGELTDQLSSRRWATDHQGALEPAANEYSGQLPLGAREVGCASAGCWKPALLLRQRAQTVIRLYSDDRAAKRQAASMLARFLQLHAAYQEDIGAASAMRPYYSRIALQLQLQCIDQAVQATDLQMAKQHKLMDNGLAAGADLTALDRQRLDLEEQRLQAEARDRQLREIVHSLSGLDYAQGQCIVEPLSVQPQQLDCQCLALLAVRERCDMQAWRTLYCQVDEDSAPLIAGTLAASIGGFSIPLPAVYGLRLLLCNPVDEMTFACSLRQELAAMIKVQEQWIRQTVMEKCEDLQLAYRRWELAGQRIESWQHRLAQLQRLEELGQAKPDQRIAAEAGLLEARTTEVTRRLEAKLAEVSLAEAVGGLAERCCRGEAWLVTGN
ncbi:MAG: hypothetical protein KF752_18255 [Pirellulaceae bacterium]|nr:hypothetical protein [Pirellulaceae bacterium]